MLKIVKVLKIDRAKLLGLAGVPEEIITENSDRGTRNWISGMVVGKEGDLTKINAGNWILHTVENPEADEVLIGLPPEDKRTEDLINGKLDC